MNVTSMLDIFGGKMFVFTHGIVDDVKSTIPVTIGSFEPESNGPIFTWK